MILRIHVEGARPYDVGDEIWQQSLAEAIKEEAETIAGTCRQPLNPASTRGQTPTPSRTRRIPNNYGRFSRSMRPTNCGTRESQAAYELGPRLASKGRHLWRWALLGAASILSLGPP